MAQIVLSRQWLIASVGIVIIIVGTSIAMYVRAVEQQEQLVLNNTQLASALSTAEMPQSNQVALIDCVASLDSGSRPLLICPSLTPSTNTLPQVAGEQIGASEDTTAPKALPDSFETWLLFGISYLVSWFQ